MRKAVKVTLDLKQLLQFAILGIDRGNYDGARALLQDALNDLQKQEAVEEKKPEEREEF